jgi:selenocysteine-specific elongation factor
VHVIGTAGHVDHGKSAVVRALTGTDPDRWEAEKRRGMTIDLGFAWTTLPSGRVASFVDVPGHVRFLKNMLVGAGGVDAVVFVVAASEGWKPQSEEHLRILELLGVHYGLVVLTKTDVVDAEMRTARRRELAERTAGSFLATAPVLEVDAVGGAGMGALRQTLDDMLGSLPAPSDQGRPRLWIDRAFAVRGAGAVVTGTLTGGALQAGETLVVVPGLGRRDATACRVRSMQCHGGRVEEARATCRVALNLAGVGVESLRRGHALVRPEQWEPTRRVDAMLHVLSGAPHEVGRRSEYLLHVGSAQQRVRLRVLGRDAVGPGERSAVRLHLRAPLALVPGDRFVLREVGRPETVGGGEVLDICPVLPAGRARPDRSVDRVVAERGWVEPELLERLTGVRRRADVGKWVVDPGALERTLSELRRAVADAGPLGLDVATLDERGRAALGVMEDVLVERGRALPAGAGDALADHPYLAALDAEPYAPPDPRELGVDPGALRELVRRGSVVECGGIWFSAGAVERAAAVVAELLAGKPQGVSVSEVRAALGTSRRYVLPLLAHLDATGVTRRRGDVRIGGPLLPGPVTGGRASVATAAAP